MAQKDLKILLLTSAAFLLLCSSPIGAEEGPSLFATCDNEMKVYFDGVLQKEDNEWKETTELVIPQGTNVLGIECQNRNGPKGILASTTEGLGTDKNWFCASNLDLKEKKWAELGFMDNNADFSHATSLRTHDGNRPDIAKDAEWIWSGHNKDWWTVCRKTLGFDFKNETVFKINSPFDVKKNKLLTVMPYIGKEYKLSFDLFVTNFLPDEWQSVLHLTIGGNAEKKYGDRTPAVWIHNDKKLWIFSAVRGYPSYYYEDKTVQEAGKWISVEISQTLIDNKYIYENKINGVSVWTVENTHAAKFEQVKVFAGDEWSKSAEGKLRNLSIETKQE